MKSKLCAKCHKTLILILFIKLLARKFCIFVLKTIKLSCFDFFRKSTMQIFPLEIMLERRRLFLRQEKENLRYASCL